MDNHSTPRIIIGITGASGAIYGVRLLEMLKDTPIETHLLISRSGQLTLTHETEYTHESLAQLADATHPVGDIGACISSGSYQTLGMIISPCSMRSLGEIASGVTSTLMTRAADVILKERRKLVLMTRESPLHLGHLRNMTAATEMGAIIAPPVPAFYTNPASLDDIVGHTCTRILDLFDLDVGKITRWQGLSQSKK